MIFVVFCILLIIVIGSMIELIGIQDGKYRKSVSSSSFPQLNALRPTTFLSELSENSYFTPDSNVKIGPLQYTIENPSVLTYKDLGYLGNTGNQLFEIAATLSIAYTNKCRVVFPSSLDRLSIYKLFDLTHLPIQDVSSSENILEFDNYEDIVVPSDGKIYNLQGYRQSYMYFEPILQHIRDIFPLRTSTLSKLSNSSYIAIHVRRTDTVNVPKFHKILKLQLNCSLKYYQEGIKRIRVEYGLPQNFPVIVATDDPVWLRTHLKDIDEHAQINSRPTKAGDFELMYFAPYLIISNSTFSYWAAMLGVPKCIIAPSYWWPQDSPVHQLTKADHQPICPPYWKFNDPLTGNVESKSYHWDETEWSSTNKLVRLARAMFATNVLRKETL